MILRLSFLLVLNYLNFLRFKCHVRVDDSHMGISSSHLSSVLQILTSFSKTEQAQN